MALHQFYLFAMVEVLSGEVNKAFDRYAETRGSDEYQALSQLNHRYWDSNQLDAVHVLQYASDPHQLFPTIIFSLTTLKGKSKITHLMTQYHIKTAVTIHFAGLTLHPENMTDSGLERLTRLSSVAVWTSLPDKVGGGRTVYKAYDKPLSSKDGTVELWFSDFIDVDEEQLPPAFRRPSKDK